MKTATTDVFVLETATIEVFVFVDEFGNHVASHDQDRLRELYEAHVQDLDGTFGTRIVKLSITVPLPTPIEITATVPCDEEQEPAVAVC